jgi:hypothetical protein
MPAPVVDAPTVVDASPPVPPSPPLPPLAPVVPVVPVVVALPPLPSSVVVGALVVLVESLAPLSALVVEFDVAEVPITTLLVVEVTFELGVDESSLSFVLPPPVPSSSPSRDGGSSRMGVAQLQAPQVTSATNAAFVSYQRLDIGPSNLPQSDCV